MEYLIVPGAIVDGASEKKKRERVGAGRVMDTTQPGGPKRRREVLFKNSTTVLNTT